MPKLNLKQYEATIIFRDTLPATDEEDTFFLTDVDLPKNVKVANYEIKFDDHDVPQQVVDAIKIHKTALEYSNIYFSLDKTKVKNIDKTFYQNRTFEIHLKLTKKK